MFIRSALTGVSAALLAASAPAIASNATNDRTEAAAGGVGSAARTKTALRAETKEKQICVTETLSSSRMPKKICRTKKEWEAEGAEF